MSFQRIAYEALEVCNGVELATLEAAVVRTGLGVDAVAIDIGTGNATVAIHLARRFGLAVAAIAVERPGGVPFGWRGLAAGGVDALLGEHGLTWLGPNFDGLNLFGANEAEVKSVALIRMAPQFPGGESAARPAVCAFGSPEEDGFTPTMGCELVAFIARVVERTAERWPLLS